MTTARITLHKLTNTNEDTMTDKHSNNFAQSRFYHDDWRDNRFEDIMYTEAETAEIRAEIARQAQWEINNPGNMQKAAEAERMMSRDEARAWKFEQEQQYRR